MANPGREAEIRATLGVPTDAKNVVILAQNSHLDWDWNAPFRTYLHAPGPNEASVTQIFHRAFDLMRGSPYYYSIAEMGFLKAFVEEHPEELKDFPSAIGDRLRIIGGGITSPDNLLPHGEAFLRNYLLGAAWAAETLGLDARKAWIPDDFGHDAQLPVLLVALGLDAAAFERVAGALNPADGPITGSPAYQVVHDSVDFFWNASDGSTILAHCLQKGYCQGNDLGQQTNRAGVVKTIGRHVDENSGNSGTSYVFISVGCDFSAPVEAAGGSLVDFAGWWNEDRWAKGSSPFFAVAASFDFYADLLFATPEWRASTAPRPFYPTPYWTGFYASRPENKILHQQATRALLGAEVFGCLADSASQGARWEEAVGHRSRQIAGAWEDLAPSTHHDYITGTATSSADYDGPVYPNDQVPLLWNALSAGEALCAAAVAQIAGRVDLKTPPAGVPVVVANALGWERGGIAELGSLPLDGAPGPSMQGTAGDGLVFIASDVPGGGYTTVGLQPNGSPASDPVATIVADGDSFVLSNGSLAATISHVGGDWVISALIDIAGGSRTVFPEGQSANELRFFSDGGGIYVFGHETFTGQSPTSFELDQSVTFTEPSATILEKGPLRVRLRTRISANVTGGAFQYERDYTLVAGEPFLRVRASGTAPPDRDSSYEGAGGYSVGIRFPVPPDTTGLAYGTTYHWDDAGALEGWDAASRPGVDTQPVFQAIHDYVIPYANATPAFAVYCDSIMAWSLYETDGSLLGIPWRNTPGDGYGAWGKDVWSHTHRYAIRVPTGLEAPSTGGPLRESREFQTPLIACAASPSSNGSLPATRAVATVTSVSDAASILLTAAKAGTRTPTDLVLRFYKPTNGVQPTVTVSVDPAILGSGAGTLTVRGVTALETDLDPGDAAALAVLVAPDGRSFTFRAVRALTTLALSLQKPVT